MCRFRGLRSFTPAEEREPLNWGTGAETLTPEEGGPPPAAREVTSLLGTPRACPDDESEAVVSGSERIDESRSCGGSLASWAE